MTTILLVILGSSTLARTADDAPLATPGFNERLNQALGPEGGVQVYQDAAGNVGTVIDPPGGDRRFTVQPPQSQWFNLGPPLQLHQRPFASPPAVPPTPPHVPDVPQKAR